MRPAWLQGGALPTAVAANRVRLASVGGRRHVAALRCLLRPPFRHLARLGSTGFGASASPQFGAICLELLARLLSIVGWSAPTDAVLRRVSGDPRTLVALALTSPDYVVN